MDSFPISLSYQSILPPSFLFYISLEFFFHFPNSPRVLFDDLKNAAKMSRNIRKSKWGTKIFSGMKKMKIVEILFLCLFFLYVKSTFREE